MITDRYYFVTIYARNPVFWTKRVSEIDLLDI